MENDVGISGPSFDQVAVVVEVAERELHPFVPHHSVAHLDFCKKNSKLTGERTLWFLTVKNFHFYALHKKKTFANILFLPVLVYSISQALAHGLMT